ncbi:helix-turn-helix domain-containing protein [Kitasatospora sp. NPDC059088]|uniref:helix-turn-helix domain-containing protein n=1 Tax=Kitasatospora sp. NPDC059088 TaxID=3346722 RepID=UPI003681F970
MGAESTAGDDGLSPRERFERWRDLVGRTRVTDTTSAHVETFTAELRMFDMGPATLMATSFPSARFRRSERMIRSSDQELYHLTLLTAGCHALERADDQRETHRVGDLCLIDSSHPYDGRFSGARSSGPADPRATGISVDLPISQLPVSPDRVRDLLGRTLSGREGTGALLADFLRGLERQAHTLEPAEAARLGTVVVDLVAAWVARELDALPALPQETRRRALMEDVHTFIRHNLHDPDLTPATVAAAHHISLSHLHHLFTRHSGGETLAASIRRQRLHKAHRDLADPALRGAPVHRIAAACGIPPRVRVQPCVQGRVRDLPERAPTAGTAAAGRGRFRCSSAGVKPRARGLRASHDAGAGSGKPKSRVEVYSAVRAVDDVVGGSPADPAGAASGEGELVEARGNPWDKGLSAKVRFEYWRDVLARSRECETITAHAESFEADVRRAELGPVVLMGSSFPSARFRRTEQMIRRSDQELYYLTLLTSGSQGLRRGRDQAETFGVGDLALIDSSTPHDVRMLGDRTPDGAGSEVTAIGIDIPQSLLPAPGRHVRDLLGRRLSGREGTGALLADFLRGLERQAHTLEPAEAARLGTVVVDLVAAWVARELDALPALPQETRRRALMEDVHTFIRHNLHDPDLTPATVAAAHHISLSHLHHLFTRHSGGETLAASIRRQRLHKAHHDLADPALRSAPVHVVAANCGIPRASEFSRAFKAAYGISPREHRHQALNAAATDGRSTG